MKKIISLSMLFSLFFVGYAQKKPVIQNNTETIVYTDIENILSNKSELGLNSKQEASFVVKNEYIKRDLLVLNDRTDMLPVEKKETEKKVKESYQLFVQRILTTDQMDMWAQMKVELDNANQKDDGLKADLKSLQANYKEEQQEIYRKYRMDKQVYNAQKTISRKKYETDRLRLMQYYNMPESKKDVMSLEEIANLVKEFDDYYNEESTTNPLKYLNIREGATHETEVEQVNSEEEE